MNRKPQKHSCWMMVCMALLLFQTLFQACSSSPSDSLQIYLSPTGMDGAKGTIRRPMKSPVEATKVAQEFLQKHPTGEVHLIFREGEYPVWEMMHFTSEGKVTLEAYPGEKPVLAGDANIVGWEETGTKGVLKADLKACGVEDYGLIDGHENRVDLYCNGKRQTLARWPNKGFTTAGKALGENDLPPNWINIHGTFEGIFEYKDDRIAEWAKEKDPILHGYWYWDWAEATQKLLRVDTEKKIIEVAKPYHHYGYRDGLRFCGLNLLCEMDSLSEYYIDREEGTIYWYAPSDFNEKEYRTTLSVASGNMVQADSVKNFTVDGLAFRGGRGGAVSIRNSDSCVVRNCLIEQFGVQAVEIKGGFNNHIERCHARELGYMGFTMKGGDRKNLIPSGFEVTDCVVEDFSLFQRTYAPAVCFSGMGLLVSHCRFENSSSSAFSMCGNELTIEYNQCYNLVTESDDQGGIDIGRDLMCFGNIYRYNHWKNIQGGMFVGAAGIRFDDFLSHQLIYGNVFEKCGAVAFGAIQINAGYDNYVTNNLFYDCLAAVSNPSWGKERFENFAKNDYMNVVDMLDGYGPLYRMRYFAMNRPVEYYPDVNFAMDNLAVKTKYLFTSSDKMIGDNNTLLNEDVQPLEYYLQPEVLKQYGLRPIPFEEFGPRDPRK